MSNHSNLSDMTYLTQITTDDGRTWAGPNIDATSWEDAERKVKLSGMAYCTVLGVLMDEFKL